MSSIKAGASRRITRSTAQPGSDAEATSPNTVSGTQHTLTTAAGSSSSAADQSPNLQRPPPQPEPSRSASASDSASDSDTTDSDSSFFAAYIQPEKMSAPNKHAISIYATLSHPPILSEGELTPKALLTFEEDCNSYFLNAKTRVTDDHKVLRILNSFRDVHVRNWITTDRAALTALSFEDFMQRLHAEFLPPNWEDKVRSRILGSKMPRSDRFIHWARSLQAENYVLQGTTSHLTDVRLRDTLEANVDPDLRQLITDIDPAIRNSLTDWMNAVEKLDAKRKLDLKRHRELLSDELHHAKRQNTRPSPSYTSQNVDPSAPRQRRLPALTLEERSLLGENRGCFKCRRFFQDHRTANCPHGFPSGDSYKTLTADDVARAKKSSERKNVPAPAHRQPKPVAALQDANQESGTATATEYSCYLELPEMSLTAERSGR